MMQWGHINEASPPCHIGGNRCAAAEAPVLPHKARIFGMSNEQVLCIIHRCSIFHAEEQESGFFGVCWGAFLKIKKKTLPAF